MKPEPFGKPVEDLTAMIREANAGDLIKRIVDLIENRLMPPRGSGSEDEALFDGAHAVLDILEDAAK